MQNRPVASCASRGGRVHGVDLMALMLQEADDHALEGPLPIAEPETAREWHGAKLLIRQVSQWTEGVSSGRQPFEQA